jgi:repressor LexA
LVSLAYCSYQQYAHFVTIAVNLTERQAELVAFIDGYQNKHGFCPTHQEMADALKLKGTYGVRQHLRLIEQKGAVTLMRGRPRTVHLAAHPQRTDQEMVDVPLVGRIAAGIPLTAVENLETTLSLPRRCFRGRNLLAVHVQGESMRDEGILPGDIAVLDAGAEVRHGQVAGVLLNDDATLKRVLLSRDAIVLRAANPAFPDTVLKAEDRRTVRFAGVLVGLVRSV